MAMRTALTLTLALTLATVSAAPSDTIERAILAAPVGRSLVDLTDRAANGLTRAPVVPLTPDGVAAWTAPAHYQAGTYCNITKVASWTCGSHCDALGANNRVLVTGGDDDATPMYYVANNGSHLLVGIRGTNGQSPLSLANDLNFFPVTPSEAYFPGIKAAGGQVHHGFYLAMTRVAAGVALAVQAAVKGGGPTQLLGLYLHSLLGASATVQVRIFASPRVGNPKFANYVDKLLGARSQALQNYNDPVPHLPPRLWGFRHSGGEVWQPVDGSMGLVACPGQENANYADRFDDPWDWLFSYLKYMDADVDVGPFAGVVMGKGCS